MYLVKTSHGKYLYSKKKEFHRTYNIDKAYRFSKVEDAYLFKHLAGKNSKIVML